MRRSCDGLLSPPSTDAPPLTLFLTHTHRTQAPLPPKTREALTLKEGNLQRKRKRLKLSPEYWLVLFHLWCCRLAFTEEGTVASLPTKWKKKKTWPPPKKNKKTLKKWNSNEPVLDGEINEIDRKCPSRSTRWAPPDTSRYFYNFFDVIIGLLWFCTHFVLLVFFWKCTRAFSWLLYLGAVSP